MEPAADNIGQLASHSRDIARRLLVMGENRLELLKLEVQEEREHLLRCLLLALGTAVLLLLAGMALTATVVVWLWAYSPVGVLLAVTSLYGVAGIYLYRRLTGLLRDQKALSATFDQLRKDPALCGKSPVRDPHESRKQWLIAESERQRAELAGEIAAVKSGVDIVTHRAQSFDSIAASAASLVTGLAALKRSRPADRKTKSSWLPAILKGAGAIATVWLAVRSYDHQNQSSNPRP